MRARVALLRSRPCMAPAMRQGHHATHDVVGGLHFNIDMADARGHAHDLPVDDTAHGEIVGMHEQLRSEEHTSELQSLMRISYAVFCLKKKNINHIHHITRRQKISKTPSNKTTHKYHTNIPHS